MASTSTRPAAALLRLEVVEQERAGAEAERMSAGAIRAGELTKCPKIIRWAARRGVPLPDLRKETVQRRLAEQPDLDPAVRAVLQARLACARVSTAKLDRALAEVGDDGRLRDLLVYHQAHTGRWSGRALQPHNLPRPHRLLTDLTPLLEAAGDLDRFRAALPEGVTVADGVSALVRPTLRAAPGNVLLIADYASVEARGLAWCAGEGHLLDLYRRGGDVYLDVASRIFGRPVTRADEAERKVGKEAVLGCGYQMGTARFAEECRRKGIDLAAAGTSVGEVVGGYRRACPAIAGVPVQGDGFVWYQGGLWRDAQAAAIEAIRTGRAREAGRCRFTREGPGLIVALPSGRRLTYRNARVVDVVPSYAGADGRPKPTLVFDAPRSEAEPTYGGKLVENLVQAVCGDLLAGTLLACEEEGLPVVLHVHDEVVVEVPSAEADDALRRRLEIMSRPPAWASGLPVQVEGFAAERYLKSPPPGGRVLTARDGRVFGAVQ